MLSIIKSVKKSSATTDVNTFLKRVFIEVVAENYKQMLYENLANQDGLSPLDPPIRANERIMSGLFGNAISVVADRSRPEARIDRDDSRANPEETSDRTKAGRVDYLAWYGNRTFAIELKMSYMDCTSSALRVKVKKPWSTLVKQTRDAQICLKRRQEEDSSRYPNPVSVGLMVVVGKHAINKKNRDLDGELSTHLNEFQSSLLGLVANDGAAEKADPESANTSPKFVATYVFPKEFREQARRRKGVATEEKIYIPFLAFVACVEA